MKRLLLLVLGLWLGLHSVSAQFVEPLSDERQKQMQASAIGAVQSMTDIFMLLGAPDDPTNNKSQLRRELLQRTFASNRVVLFNDLEEHGPDELRAGEYLERFSDEFVDGVQITYSGYESSPVYLDQDGEEDRYVVIVRVERHLVGRHRREGPIDNVKTVYFLLENLRSVPLIYGSTGEKKPRMPEVPTLDTEELARLSHRPQTPLVIGDPGSDEEEPVLSDPAPRTRSAPVSATDDCGMVQLQARTYIQELLDSDATKTTRGDLMTIDMHTQQLSKTCNGRESRRLKRNLKTLSQDVEDAEKAEAIAVDLTRELADQKLAHLSKRDLSAYKKDVRKATENLTPRLIQQPQTLIDQKTREYNELSRWHASAVRHPRLHLKGSVGGSLFMPNVSGAYVQENYEAIFRYVGSLQVGWRINRPHKSSTTPNPKTGKRTLARAHVLGVFYQQTLDADDPFGYQGPLNPFEIRDTQFREFELGLVLWEWWRLSAGGGQQWNSDARQELLREYYTATSGVSFRFRKIFELDIACTSLWGEEFPQPTWRASASLAMVLKI